jgi:hypothetical protein
MVIAAPPPPSLAEAKAILHLTIDRDWDATKMAVELTALTFLYSFHAILEISARRTSEGERDDEYWRMDAYYRLTYSAFKHGYTQLEIREIHFASLGLQKLVGCGKAIVRMAEDIALLDTVRQKKRKQEIEALRLKNMEKYIEILTKAKVPQRELFRLLSGYAHYLEIIDDFREKKRIVDVKIEEISTDEKMSTGSG